MAGKIKRLIDEIVEARAQGNETVYYTTQAKLTLKGIDPGKYDERTEDDPKIIERLYEIADEMGIRLPGASRLG